MTSKKKIGLSVGGIVIISFVSFYVYLCLHQNKYNEWGCGFDYNYERMTGSFSLNKTSSLKQLDFKLYKDGHYIRSYSLKAGSSPIHLNLKVSGAQHVSIRTSDTEISANTYSNEKDMKIFLLAKVEDKYDSIGTFIVK